jgi:hypothetical protein
MKAPVGWFLRHRVLTGIGAFLLLGTFTGIAVGNDNKLPTSASVGDSIAVSAASEKSAANQKATNRAAADQTAADKAAVVQAAANQVGLDQAAANQAAAEKAAANKAIAAKAALARPPPARTALAAVSGLTVKGRAPRTGYTRAQFGQSWFDTNRNGCDTRNDILDRDLGAKQMKNACKVLAGTLAFDPYTGRSIRFVYGGASELDIDHVVALSDAWQKGAALWPAGKRLALANDPLNLLAVDSSANRSKGDGDTATWLPPNHSYRCAYVARQVAVKGKYGIWITAAERDAMTRVLRTCPSMALPGPGSAATVAALPKVSTKRAPPIVKREPVPAVAPPPPGQNVYYANCTAARAAGAAPIMRGEPGYARKLDRDNDGIACE